MRKCSPFNQILLSLFDISNAFHNSIWFNIKDVLAEEQTRDVRHEYHLTSIRNLPSKLSSGLYVLYAGVSVWTDLDPRGVTYGRDSDAEVR